MATKLNSRSPTIKRIMKEAAEFSNAPSPDYTATPLESDLFEWHFTLRGPPNSAFGEGIYHGRIVLPPTYPLRPPMFRFVTPSGRFEANREICLSISGHHEETWQPAWGVRTALVALRSFMETDAAGQIGGLTTADGVRRKLARESRAWTCPACGKSNEAIIRDVEEQCKALEASQQAEGGNKTEVEVPPELKLAFRDDLVKAQAAGSRADNATDDAESAQLAEGFVQTAPPQRQPQSPSQPQTRQHEHQYQQPQPPTSSLPARPAQGAPAPTRTVPLPDPVGQAVVQRARNLDPNAGVPVWLDYAIMTFGGLLVAMLFKMMLGY